MNVIQLFYLLFLLYGNNERLRKDSFTVMTLFYITSRSVKRLTRVQDNSKFGNCNINVNVGIVLHNGQIFKFISTNYNLLLLNNPPSLHHPLFHQTFPISSMICSWYNLSYYRRRAFLRRKFSQFCQTAHSRNQLVKKCRFLLTVENSRHKFHFMVGFLHKKTISQSQ